MKKSFDEHFDTVRDIEMVKECENLYNTVENDRSGRKRRATRLLLRTEDALLKR